MVSKNTEVEHIAKQRKKKNLPDTMVYGSQGGIVEMHKLEDYTIENITLKKQIVDMKLETIKVNERTNKIKDVLKEALNKIEVIERKLKTYGLE